MTAALAQSAECWTEVELARSEMLRALVEELNVSGIPYCLLSGCCDFPQAGASDVDFMVCARDAERVPGIMRTSAQRSQAMLVQAIQHETGACYFVLAKPVAGGVAYLHPDCTTDYRRDGRLWLRAEELLSRRRRYGSFFVPAVGDEFGYYLIKKVLKQAVSDDAWLRLRTLFIQCQTECCEQMRRFWSAKTAGVIASAVVRDDLEWMQSNLPGLLVKLEDSAPIEEWGARRVQALREWRRWIERAVHPTGLTVAITGGSAARRVEFATMLEENLRPAFRRTGLVEARSTAFGVREWLAKVRSTLVITTKDRRAARIGSRGQIRVDLADITPPNVEMVTQDVLEFMAQRLQRRMRSKVFN